MSSSFKDRKLLLCMLIVLAISIISLSVAYAALSITLNIAGNAEISAASWDIRLGNILVDTGSVNSTVKPTITDNKVLNFNVILNEPGDYYKFTVDVVNYGTIDAMIDGIIKNIDLTDEQAKYIKYDVSYSDGSSIAEKQLLSVGESKTIFVMVSYRTDINSSDLPSSTLALSLTYTQADSSAVAVFE